MPIRAESHQPPGRAAMTWAGADQLCRSAEREIQMSARWVRAVTGRWNRTYSPLILYGSSAPFLSSGARTTPSRSAVRKSWVVAIDSPGPPGPKEVKRITHLSISGHPGDPRVLHAPGLVWSVRLRLDQGAIVDDPVGHPVTRPSHREMADPAPILDPAQQHGGAVDLGGTGVEDRVHRVRPALRGQ